MSNTTSAYGTSTISIEKAYDQEMERLHEVTDVKSDINFVSIFANLIRKMDDASQAVVS